VCIYKTATNSSYPSIHHNTHPFSSVTLCPFPILILTQERQRLPQFIAFGHHPASPYATLSLPNRFPAFPHSGYTDPPKSIPAAEMISGKPNHVSKTKAPSRKCQQENYRARCRACRAASKTSNIVTLSPSSIESPGTVHWQKSSCVATFTLSKGFQTVRTPPSKLILGKIVAPSIPTAIFRY